MTKQTKLKHIKVRKESYMEGDISVHLLNIRPKTSATNKWLVQPMWDLLNTRLRWSLFSVTLEVVQRGLPHWIHLKSWCYKCRDSINIYSPDRHLTWAKVELRAEYFFLNSWHNLNNSLTHYAFRTDPNILDCCPKVPVSSRFSETLGVLQCGLYHIESILKLKLPSTVAHGLKQIDSLLGQLCQENITQHGNRAHWIKHMM